MSLDFLESKFSHGVKRASSIQDSLDVVLTPELGKDNREPFSSWITLGQGGREVTDLRLPAPGVTSLLGPESLFRVDPRPIRRRSGRRMSWRGHRRNSKGWMLQRAGKETVEHVKEFSFHVTV